MDSLQVSQKHRFLSRFELINWLIFHLFVISLFSSAGIHFLCQFKSMRIVTFCQKSPWVRVSCHYNCSDLGWKREFSLCTSSDRLFWRWPSTPRGHGSPGNDASSITDVCHWSGVEETGVTAHGCATPSKTLCLVSGPTCLQTLDPH